MKRRVLIAGLGVFIFTFLNISLTRPVHAQICSVEDGDAGEQLNTQFTITSTSAYNTDLVLRVFCPSGETCPEDFDCAPGRRCSKDYCFHTDNNGHASGIIGPFSIEGMYGVKIHYKLPGVCHAVGGSPTLCQTDFAVGEGIKYDICQGDTNGQCKPCVTAGNAWTAIGCIHTSDPQEFTIWLLRTGIGIAGGIALLLMVMGGVLIILSAGDPQKLQSGKDILTSAIAGLIIIIFSVFLLQLIGVQILMIPGFR